ncbi:helix-turn-helix domain-containing protein [Nocardia terpenica]|uniref:Helix-turn-helix domain-containing protein n=1 Tax=Nocardia terpenica TaxID=455432 RepID=A0A6G9YZZ2_9NOCA|nr:helix-turn-helix transcriptional regulator [Nocardia terpenica]QIS18750.1 helix-turn-helix domain-containing protein [Nocardia terpenica]
MRDDRSDPSALRFLVGHDLRAAREHARIKQADAAKHIGCTAAKLSYMEAGKTAQHPDEVAELLRYYRVGVEHVERVVSLAGRADHGTWWAPFGEVLPDWFKTFVGLEGLADSQFEYADKVMPGQLQTPDYATALLADSLQIAPMDAAQAVRARMARQRITGTSAPLRLQTVIEEVALDRPVGGPRLMRTQLEHLLKSMELDHVDVQVIPTAAAVHAGLSGGAFILLDFAEARSIAYVEHHTGALYLQDRSQVDLYSLAAKRLRGQALSASDSVEVIASRISKYKKMERK